MRAVKAGAVFAGSREAGFWAVWQEEADRARTASMAIRTWSFATRIFLYEMRIAPRGLKSAEFYQKSYPAVGLGSTPKRNFDGYFRHRSKRQSQPAAELDTPVVRTPGLNRFLDVRTGKFLGECPFGQFGGFRIGGEAQRDELAFG